jgi:ERF superfamily
MKRTYTRRVTMSNSKNLYQRLNSLMADVTSVFKGTEVSMGGGRGYSAVSHDDVTKLIHMPLVNNGIFVELGVISSKLSPIETTSEYNGKSQVKTSYLAEVTIRATFVNVDKPEERFSVDSYAYALDSSDKAVGKAMSMATKYIYLKNLLLESTDEEEQRHFEKEHKPLPQAALKTVTQSVVGTQTANAPAASTAPRGSFRKNPATTVAPSGDL